MKTFQLFLVLFCVSLSSVFYSCNPDDKQNVDPAYVIKGVSFYDVNAMLVSSLGTPDDVKKGDGVQMEVYPIPCKTNFTLSLQLSNAQPVTVKANLIHVVYPDAPASFKNGSEDIPIKVENNNSAGSTALSQSKDLGAAPGGQHVSMAFNVPDLPKGFYKVIVEISDGRKLHAAVCIQ